MKIKQFLSLKFFIGMVCILLLSSIIYVKPVNAIPTSFKFVGDIAQTPTMSIAESINKLVPTGKVKNGNLEGF